MRVYVAGKYGDTTNPRVQEIQNELRAAGHKITYDWTSDAQEGTNQAMADMNGVLTADAFVLVTEEHAVVYCGAICELGMALASGIPVYVIGDALDTKRDVQGACIFMKVPAIMREDAYRTDLLS
jgi:nucleoside 2-deoxyribosyltransferase